MHGEAVGAEARARRAPQQRVHLAGRADADGVAEADLGAAHGRQPLGDVGDLRERHVALPRVAEAHRDVPAHGRPALAGALDDGREHLQRLRDAPVEVALRERLGRAAEHRDLADAGGQRPVQAAQVGHEHRARAAGGRPSRASSSSRRRAGGPSRGGRSWSPRPCAGRRATRRRMSSAFTSTGTTAGLVLQAVARADLVDLDPLGQAGQAGGAHGAGSAWTRASGWSHDHLVALAHEHLHGPGERRPSTCSIFIASTASSGWPASTASPAATWTATTAPGIGLRTSASSGLARAHPRGRRVETAHVARRPRPGGRAVDGGERGRVTPSRVSSRPSPRDRPTPGAPARRRRATSPSPRRAVPATLTGTRPPSAPSTSQRSGAGAPEPPAGERGPRVAAAPAGRAAGAGRPRRARRRAPRGRRGRRARARAGRCRAGRRAPRGASAGRAGTGVGRGAEQHGAGERAVEPGQRRGAVGPGGDPPC